MKRRDRAPRAPAPARAGNPPSPAPPLPLRHPAVWIAALVAAACVVLSVSFRISDPDLWQHLLTGRVIWETHSVPARQIWCWPTYGEPQVLPSWGFRALLWPFWQLGGLAGLYAWRWTTTLAAFALLWAAARRMGARGLAPLVVIALAALIYRQRSQVRPETLVAVLLALQVWILETRRSGGPDRAPWVVAIALVWANTHISYYLGLALLGIHVLDAALTAGRGAAARRLGWVLVAACAASFANPFGWRALWQPFEYVLHWRHEPIFLGISELRPVQWGHNLRNGLPVLLAAWLLLMLWRARRAGLDRVEALTFALFAGLGLSTQRFVGFLALAAVPSLARDLDAWIAGRRWPPWTAPAPARAAIAAIACVALSLPEWSRAEYPLGVGVEWNRSPVRACDFVAGHGIAGRAFNPFHFGGYMLWRFWPDRGRLPFMDIHQTGTREDRRLAAGAFASREARRALMARHPFDWALLDRRSAAGARLLDFFDQDTSWSLVFADDAAALYVKREPRFEGLVRAYGRHAWPAGWGGLGDVGRRCRADSAFRARAWAELEREAASSPWNSTAHNFMANLALLEGRGDEARRHLEAAMAVDPHLPQGRERLARLKAAAR